MNINKIVFAVLGAIILILIVMLVIQLNKSTTPVQSERQSGDFSIWLLWDSSPKIDAVIRDFKEVHNRYRNVNIWVEFFSDRDVYTQTIVSALWAGIAPDIFLLNNREFSPLENFILGLDPTVVAPNTLRRDFHTVFADDLIVKVEDTDVLKGIPVWFQVPWLYYSRRHFPRSSELQDWWRFTWEMQATAQRSNIAPIALWVSSGIWRLTNIVLSFLSQEGAVSLQEVQSWNTRQVFNQFITLWLLGDRSYVDITKNKNTTDIENFTSWEVASILAYPRDIIQIADIWFQSNMLFVSPFPLSEWKTDAIAIDYDYFVIQKNTWNLSLAEDFISYLASERWQRAYIEQFPEQLPAHSSVAIDLKNQAIHPSFNITQWDFLRDQSELVSFSVGNYGVFESWLREILENDAWRDTAFQALKNKIACYLDKYQNFQNFSRSCR